MRFQTPLVPATLIRRYKRFLADMRLADGREVTAHCANPGSMLGMATPGMTCWLEPNDDPRRKLRHSWKLIEGPAGEMVVVDTGIANAVAAEALETGCLPALSGHHAIRREVRMGSASRVDFVLDGPAGATFVEVKSVTLLRGGWAEFPDSVTARGRRHIEELAALARAGGRAAMLYVVARDDAARVRIAADIDPAYARAFDQARADGVEMHALACRIDTCGVCPAQPLAVDAAPQAVPGLAKRAKGD